MLNLKINLDHKPEPVSFEPLPDGCALLRLFSNVAESAALEDSSGETTSGGWTADEATCVLPAARASSESAESVAAAFDDWYQYAAAWQPADNIPPTIEQQLSDLTELCMSLL